MGRRLVNHGHVRVDGRRVDIPSYLVEAGQVVALSDAAAKVSTVAAEMAAGRPLPEWLTRTPGQAHGRVARLPQRSDVELPIDERQIVSFYSR